jgi:hypothetical protein
VAHRVEGTTGLFCGLEKGTQKFTAFTVNGNHTCGSVRYGTFFHLLWLNPKVILAGLP